MSELETSVLVNLKGNLERNARRYGSSINRFSKNGSRDITKLNNRFKKHNSVLKDTTKRYAGIVSLAGAALAAGKVIDLDAQLARLKTDSQATTEQIALLKKELFEVASDPSIRLNPEDILKGASALISATGDFPNTLKNLKSMATFMQATGTAGEDAGKSIAINFKQGITDASENLKILDVQTKQSLKGSVSIRDSSKVGKGVFAPLAAATVPGVETLTEGGALLQVTIDAVKSSDEAAEAIKSLLSFMQKTDVQKELNKLGINVRRPNSIKLKKLSESIPEIFDALGGDFGKIGKLFGESGVKVFQGFSLPGNRQQLATLASIEGDGSLLKKDSRTNAQTTKAAVRSIGNKTDALIDSIVSEPLKNAADAIDFFQKTDAITNLLAINFALGSSIRWPFDKLAETLFPVQKTVNASKELSGLNDNGEKTNSKIDVNIKIDSEGRASINKLKTSNPNINADVDTGLQVITP